MTEALEQDQVKSEHVDRVIDEGKKGSQSAGRLGFSIGFYELAALVVVPTCIYLTSYCYEFCYVWSMGIPVQLIELSYSRVLLVGIVSMLVILFGANVLATLSSWLKIIRIKDEEKKERVVTFITTVVFSLFILGYAFLLEWHLTGLILAAIVIMVSVDVFVRGFEKSNVRTEYDRVFENILGPVNNAAGGKFYITAGWLVFLMLLSASLGRLEAKRGWFYSELEYNAKEYLLLRSYGNNIVLGNYKNGFLTGEVMIVSQEDIRGITLKPYAGWTPEFKDN
ncbi:hypothetical protein [Poriferisphaera sp. WC338]|uniref:hypothetical protein n=1 Tax=Poriferisphaera sp. WC338 TaxID=3425129 RepID=UPI003D81765F